MLPLSPQDAAATLMYLVTLETTLVIVFEPRQTLVPGQRLRIKSRWLAGGRAEISNFVFAIYYYYRSPRFAMAVKFHACD